MAISNNHHLPVRQSDANKYSHGVVAIIAGSDKYPGAAVLCVGGARRGGAGYIQYVALSRIATELVLHQYPDVVPLAKAREFKGDSIVIGSGAPKLPRGFTFPDSRYLVLDSDAMALAANSNTAFTVITPHEGEAEKLGFPIKNGDRRGTALAIAKHFHVIVVLKGHNSVIASPDGTVIVDKSGGSELATAGTGDVLAGLIGSMLSSWAPSNLKECIQVVAKAVAVHGLAGKYASKSLAPITATDLLEALPKVLKNSR
jgi:ADP-dependent NAD(P)H-hydrate dehydratase / NAD(P)H-hydrate epimerase